jgi:hypothetical protein
MHCKQESATAITGVTTGQEADRENKARQEEDFHNKNTKDPIRITITFTGLRHITSDGLGQRWVLKNFGETLRDDPRLIGNTPFRRISA